jgi:YHS domain-containing protein
MKRVLAQVVCLALGLLGGRAAADADGGKAKEALKPLQDFIGGWKGAGGPVKQRPLSSELWNETINWGWRFKGDDAWLTVEFDKGKHLKNGELRYLPAKKLFELTLNTVRGQKLVFEGEFKNDYLTMERQDPDTKETQKLTMNLAGDGVRFIYRFDRKPEGRTLFIKDYQVAATKIGESLGKKEKQNECIVSGGAGTMTVSFKGETFYVCCSGCRDEFNANPEKYVKEWKAKKAGGK